MAQKQDGGRGVDNSERVVSLARHHQQVGRWNEEVDLASAENDGLVRSKKLRELGLSLSERRRALAGFEHLRRGSYWASPEPNLYAEHRLQLSAVLQDRPDAVGSHVSAAVIHQSPVPIERLDRIHVSLISGASRRGFRHSVHTHARRVDHGDVAVIDGLRCTSAARTVIDCARLLDVPTALCIADDALHRGVVDAPALIRQLALLRRTRGIASARRVVELADGRSESPGESRTRLIVVGAGFEVEPQAVITNASGQFIARVDLRIKGSKLIVEFDGRAKFSHGETVEAAHWAAKLRRDRIEDEGHPVLAVDWSDLARPRQLIQRLERALVRAGDDPTRLRALRSTQP